MTLTAAALVQAAQAAVEGLSVAEARVASGQAGWLFVDVRETVERADGAIPGSVHAPRGNLEFLIDPQHPAFLPALGQARQLIFVCGSGARAALSARLAQEFGYETRYLIGGMAAWNRADDRG